MTAAGPTAPVEWRVRGWFVVARGILARVPFGLFLLALRIGVALVFFTSGRIKLITWDFTIKLFSDEYHLPVIPPEIAATVAAFSELTFSSLIIVGFATRLATLPLLGMLAVIEAFVYPDSWPDTLFWGGSLLLILSRGPGPVSLDALFERTIATRSPRLGLLTVGAVLTTASIGLWYFAHNDLAHAALTCLFTTVAQCGDGSLAGLTPISAVLPYAPPMIWVSLAILLAGGGWVAATGDGRLLRAGKAGQPAA